MKKYFYLILLIFGSELSFAQQAGDYFPAQTGFEWKFREVPLDSASNPINASAYFRIDYFESIANYEGKPANVVLTKTGQLQNILLQPYSDSLFYYTEGTDGFEYFNIREIEEFLLNLDSAGIVPNFSVVDLFTSLQDWYPVYQFASIVNTEYTLKQVDTSVFISPFTIPVRFRYIGKRLQDETIQTALGSFECKKFLTQWKVSASIFSVEYNLLTTNDTNWIAQGNWIVQSITPGQYVDLDSLPFTQIDPFPIQGLETKLTDSIVVSSVEDNEGVPYSFVLNQNYPNPFNPSTKISWQVPVGSHQTLKIYNVLGNEVATLVDEYKPTGTYEVDWDVSNYPSGVYFYQLKTDGFVATKKMILMK